jgi:subtilisin family serine protease
VHVAHNAIAVTVDASALPAIRQMPGVAAVRPVINYRLTLEETVPYVGATAVHEKGFEGEGIVVAVLDSGVDYTHRNLGGPGTIEAYTEAYGDAPGDPRNETRDGLFPTEKVIEGFDFVGEAWPEGDLTEDPDPIDAPGAPVAQGGHGTHVSDIVAGNDGGSHRGVAPEASLLGVKVCSSISTACSGVALLRGMDFALDPNGDGDMSDAADVINMSLGSDYGQEEDDLAEASAAAVRLGVVVVTAAGNAANRPYIVSSPSIGEGVISVAQTQVPSAQAFPLVVNAPEEIAGTYPNTATVAWAPIGDGFTGDVVYVGQGCPADSIEPGSPEDPYLADPAGKVALIDRGACAVSLKVDRAAEAGAIGVLIGLIAPGDAVSFSYGGGDDFVPTLVIQQSLSNSIKGQLEEETVNVTVSPANAIDLVGGMVSSSARGPSISHTAIKPEIGAPGGSVSAVSATGDQEEAFSGTSGATPMVSGAAALLIEAYPERSPEQIKAMLMNSAETEIFTNQALLPGELAPISRIGAGELRVDRALELSSIARSRRDHSASLSFGFQEVIAFKTLRRTLLVENFSDTAKTFNITTSFRYADDESTGAVRVVAPDNVHVRAHGRREIHVIMIIDGRKLADWPLDGGANGGDGGLLNAPEFDGYVKLTAGDEELTVPWHVLPRKAAAIKAVSSSNIEPGDKIRLLNAGLAPSGLDAFSLTGVSPRVDESQLPGPGDSFAIIDMRAVGVRLVTPGVLQFAINTYGRRAHPNYPAEFDVIIDTNRDGTPDFVVFNTEIGGFAVSGQNVVFVLDLATETATPVAYTDADLQSGNVILTAPTLALGITDDTTIDFEVAAFDNYFTGELTDAFETMTYTPSTPKFIATNPPDVVPAHSTVRFGTAAVPGGEGASPSQIGLLLMHRLDARREATIVRME